MRIATALGAVALILVGAGGVSAQLASGDCSVVYAGSAQLNQAFAMGWFGRGVQFRCPNGVRASADSAVSRQQQQQLELIGNVRYTDATRTLTADRAVYERDQGQIRANGNARVNDSTNGSTLMGPAMSIFLPTATRSTELILVTGTAADRPHAILVDTLADGSPGDTTDIVADNQINISGGSTFVARSNPVITRGSVIATADEAEYAADGALHLNGNARLVSDEFVLTGDTIDTESDEERRLEAVVANGDADLVTDSTDIQVTGSTVRILMTEGEIERLVATVHPVEEQPDSTAANAEAAAEEEELPEGEEAADTAQAPPRARAESSDFMLEADSIDVILPDRELEAVVAVGQAYTERFDADSTRAEMVEVLRKDWMRGDTITATFGVAESEAGTEERVLESLTALGGATPASSFYLVRDTQAPSQPPGFSYQLAHSIHVIFDAGSVREVQLVGGVRGLYLAAEQAAAVAAGGDPGTTGGGRLP